MKSRQSLLVFFAEIMKLSPAWEAKLLLIIRLLHPVRTTANDHCLTSDLDHVTMQWNPHSQRQRRLACQE